MHGRYDEVTRLGRIQGQLHGLTSAHFPNHDDIWIFSKRVEQCLLKRGRVPAHLPLAMRAVLFSPAGQERVEAKDHFRAGNTDAPARLAEMLLAKATSGITAVFDGPQ